MRFSSAVLVAVLAATAAAAAGEASKSPFVFQVPPGWRDLTPGVPEENYVGVPSDVAAKIKTIAPLFLAADVAHAHGRFMTNVRATLVGSSGAINEQELNGYVDAFQAEGGNFVEKDHLLDDWSGVTIGKIVGELTIADHVFAQVAYVIPGTDGRVFLVYSTLPDELAAYAPIFEAAARATKGAVQPVSLLERTGVRGLILGFVGAALALVIIRRARARRMAAP